MTISKAIWTLKNDGSLGEFDVAAGVGEDVLNSFAEAHHTREYAKPLNVYRGIGSLAEFGISYEYKIPKSATFDLAPIADGKKSYTRWLLALPEIVGMRSLAQIKSLQDNNEANVRVHVPEVNIELTPRSGSKVTLSYSTTVTAFVCLQGDELQIVPISASVDDPTALVVAVAEAVGAREQPEGNSQDNCYELQELIKYIINDHLSRRISSFVQRIPLPTPIKLFDGLSLISPSVAVRDNFVIFTANTLVSERSIDNAFPTVSLNNLGDAKNFVGAMSAAINYTTGGATQSTKFISIHNSKAATAAVIPASGIFLYMTEKFLSEIIAKSLTLNRTNGECGRWGIFEGCYNWFVKTFNPATKLVGSELHVDFDFESGAGVKARVHTHCGPTGWVPFGVDLIANPARTIVKLFFKNNREVAMSAGVKPFLISVRSSGFPWPISEIIDQLLSVITTSVDVIIAILGLRLTRRLINLPDKFPGTDFAYTPIMDQQIVNVDGNLAILGTIKFK